MRRSKSDVGGGGGGGPGTIPNTRTLIIDRKRINNLDNDETFASKKKSQLSPIIEATSKENYFGDSSGDAHQPRAVRSEDRTLDNKDDLRIGFDSGRGLGNNFEGSRSLDSLHSSQLPQQKLPLTKGLTVDGMVKRLSMERFSPPPRMNSPGFSYIHSNKPIVYAHVLRGEKGFGDSGEDQQYQHNGDAIDGHHHKMMTNNVRMHLA